jgi:hypothetical protein
VLQWRYLKKEALMLKGLAVNPFIDHNSTLAQIEAELEVSLNRAEALDWDITDEDERDLLRLTNLARAKGSKRDW